MKNMKKRKLTMLDAMLHEIRGPLTAIGLMSDLIDNEDKRSCKESLDSALEILRDASYDSLRILDHISQYSRSELHDLEIKPERIEIVSILRSISDDFSRKARLRNNMKIEFSSNLQECYVDFTKILFQILVNNMINNSIDHSQGSRLRIHLKENFITYDNNNEIQIKFEDDGIGVHPTEKKLVFLPFKRGSNSSMPGSGIGLALVSEILAAHGGCVSLIDSRGSGATFVVNLRSVM